MKFKENRMTSGMTQDEVASRLGIARSTIAMWETGASKPRADRLVELAALYNCSIDDLLGGNKPDGDDRTT